MYIREELVYMKHIGTLIGFGQINDHMLAFEHSLEPSSTSNTDLAKSVMTIMVKGLFNG